MKKIVFDIDGVLLSEERYFDVSGLVIWEWLYGKSYMGLPAEQDDFNVSRLSEGQTAAIRNKIWRGDDLLKWMKSRGINSNCDMVHAYLITLIWLMAKVYKERSGDKLSVSIKEEKDVQKIGQILMGIPVPSSDAVLDRWKSWIPEKIRGNDVLVCLEEKISNDIENTDMWTKQFSNFYKMHVNLFHSWYLGDDVFIAKNHKLPYSGNKEGFLEKEMPLAPAEQILNLFRELKKHGYEIGIATGRIREAVEIPFKKLGWYKEFEPEYIGTASDAFKASTLFNGMFLDKPHPFIYYCGIWGRNEKNFASYINGSKKLKEEDEVYICGDAYSDLLGTKAAGAVFVGVLTGLDGEKTAEIFEKEGARCIRRITELSDVLHI